MAPFACPLGAFFPRNSRGSSRGVDITAPPSETRPGRAPSGLGAQLGRGEEKAGGVGTGLHCQATSSVSRQPAWPSLSWAEAESTLRTSTSPQASSGGVGGAPRYPEDARRTLLCCAHTRRVHTQDALTHTGLQGPTVLLWEASLPSLGTCVPVCATSRHLLPPSASDCLLEWSLQVPSDPRWQAGRC